MATMIIVMKPRMDEYTNCPFKFTYIHVKVGGLIIFFVFFWDILANPSTKTHGIFA